MRKILVPVERSDISKRAVMLALSLAEAGGDRIYLFRVGDEKHFGKLVGEDLKLQLDKELAEMGDLLTESIVTMSEKRELNLERIGRVHKRFSVGNVATEILKMAGNISSEIILFGVPSAEDPDYEKGKFTLNADMASQVVKRAPCSVFAVKALDEIFVIAD